MTVTSNMIEVSNSQAPLVIDATFVLSVVLFDYIVLSTLTLYVDC